MTVKTIKNQWGEGMPSPHWFLWKLLGSNQRPPACKAGALNQLS